MVVLNTLDRFLIRRDQPSERQAASSERPREEAAGGDQPAVAPPEADGTAAQNASADSQDGCRRAGTLDSFLVRRDAAAAEATISGRLVDVELLRRPLPRSLAHRQVSGRLDPGAQAYARQLEALRMQQLACLGTHPWGRAALSPAGPVYVPCEGREGCASIQALQFDSQGELLVAASDEGLLSVHSMQQLLGALPPWRSSGGGGSDDVARAGPPPPAVPAEAAADPLLLLDVGMPRVHAVRWNPSNENVVGVTSVATRQLLLFDLAHTQGRPREVLSIPAQSASLGLAGSIAVGLTDLAFLGGGGGNGGAEAGGGYIMAAGGVGGQVFLWDWRAKAVPQAYLHSQQHSGAVYCLQLAACGRVVVAGTQSGEVKLWDLRGGSGGALHFGGMVHHHPLLDSLSVRVALAGVPGLVDQTAIPASAVHWLQLDPLDERRLAFHLGCGWSGVLDLPRHTITHLHAPPQPGSGGPEGGPPPSADYAPALHRRPCWAAAGGALIVPSRHSKALQLLDVSPSRYARCAVPAEGAGGDGRAAAARGASWQAEGPAGVEVQLSQPAICAAAHPGGGLVVAGGRGGRLSLVVRR